MDRLDDTWLGPKYRLIPTAMAVCTVVATTVMLVLLWILAAVLTGIVPVDQPATALTLLGLVFGAMALYMFIRLFGQFRAKRGDAPPVLALPMISANPAMSISQHIWLFVLVVGAGAWSILSITTAMSFAGTHPIERLRWSWRPIRPLTFITNAAGKPSLRKAGLSIIGVALVQYAFAYIAMRFLDSDFWSVAPLQVVIGMLWLHEITGEHQQPSVDDRRPRPNEGIRRSARYALLHGTASCLLAILVLGITGVILQPAGVHEHFCWALGVLFGLIMGTLRAARFGGMACVAHWTVRYRLARDDAAPLRYQRFLHRCEQRILLRRVGNGYAFPHRLLQQHFAVPADALLARLDTAT